MLLEEEVAPHGGQGAREYVARRIEVEDRILHNFVHIFVRKIVQSSVRLSPGMENRGHEPRGNVQDERAMRKDQETREDVPPSCESRIAMARCGTTDDAEVSRSASDGG
jgi:hypothetical protein